MKVLFLIILTISSLFGNYSFRKYQHVKEFYKDISPYTIKLALKYNVPPAAILAIAGLESGYGSGYVAQITGNILSLGANKNEAMLPPLYLPYSKSLKRIVFDEEEIKKLSKDDLSYKLRAKSYKKDYRPSPYAGTTKNLSILKHNKELMDEARAKNIEDFVSKWISTNSKFKPFREARKYLDRVIKEKGKEALFSKEVNYHFIDLIGGRPNSFNYRKSWPKKVKLIMKKVGLIELVKDIELNHKSFEEAWNKK